MKQFEMDGWVCGQIETRCTQSGKRVTEFSVNSPDRRKNQQGEWETVPQFFKCQYWHKSDNDFRAVRIADKAHLFLIGSPRYEEWEGQNGKRSRMLMNVRDLFPIEAGKPHGEPAVGAVEYDAYGEEIPF